jgi:hypothetical protein
MVMIATFFTSAAWAATASVRPNAAPVRRLDVFDMCEFL